MKTFILVSIFRFLIPEKDTFSQVFINYSKQFDTLIVYSTINYSQVGRPYKIIGVVHGKWYYIEYYKREALLKKDSIMKKSCSECKNTFSEILNNKIQTLPNESEIISNCKTTRDTIINGKPAVEINDFNANSDLEIHVIEYKFGKQKRKISYKSPDEALKVCPESKERNYFSRIIDLIDKKVIPRNN